jgi:hypothetical protein
LTAINLVGRTKGNPRRAASRQRSAAKESAKFILARKDLVADPFKDVMP